jgi:hypothetical protein
MAIEITKNARKDVLTGFWNGHLANKTASEVNVANLKRSAKKHGEDFVVGQIAQPVPGVPTPTLKQITIKDQIKREETNITNATEVMSVIDELLSKEK